MRDKIEWTPELFEEKKNELLAKERFGFSELESIVEMLRCPYGCPWDREQTHRSVRNDLIEEAYELVEGIDKGDVDLMREESGDVILQSVFHSVIAKYDDEYCIDDVLDELCRKLIVRHPHVFSSVEAKTTDRVLENWDRIKSDSKGRLTVADKMESVPKVFPALMRANKVGKKSSKLKFDYKDKYHAAKKVSEELEEVINATETEAHEEIGDLLFSVVCLSRMLGVDPEKALSDATDKFIERFRTMETSITESKIKEDELTEKLLLEEWSKAKTKLLSKNAQK